GSPSDVLRLLAAEFLRPHPRSMAAALLAMLLQSLLLLPPPLIQGWVLDCVLPLFDPAGATPADAGRLGWLIGLALGAALVCLVGRMTLAWRAAATMTRV